MITLEQVLEAAKSNLETLNPVEKEYLYTCLTLGEVGIGAGNLFDWVRGNKPKDLDFILNTDQDLDKVFPNQGRTGLGGIRVKEPQIDMFRLKDTFRCEENPTWQQYVDSRAFFIDSIVLVLPSFTMYDAGAVNALNNDPLALKLEDPTRYELKYRLPRLREKYCK